MQVSDSLSRDRVGHFGWMVAWVAWSGVLSASMSLMLSCSLFGRLPLWAAIKGWMSPDILTASLLLCLGWWLGYGVMLYRRGGPPRLSAALVPAIPILLGASLPLLLIYSSDLLNHYFYYSMVNLNQPKTMAILLIFLVLSFLLQALEFGIAAGRSRAEAYRWVLAQTRGPIIMALLAVLGGVQVSAYLDRFYDDFILRYWPVSDALITGAPYPATAVAGVWRSYFVEGGLAKYLIDLPVYPVVVAASFKVFGHNVVASYMPSIIANVILPPVLYLLYREVLQHRIVALLLVGATLMFPPMRLFVLNWTGPDPVFYVLFITSCWLYARVSKGDSRMVTWAVLGLASAGMMLTRPEGVAYAGVYVAAAMTARTGVLRKIVLGGLFVAPVAAFSLFMMLTFRMPWPQNWNGSMGLRNIADNLQTLSQGGLERAGQQMRLSPESIVVFTCVLLVSAAAGGVYLLFRRWRLALLFAPAWVNVVSVLIIDPRVSGSYLWYDFFRHISFPIPLMVLAMGVAGEAAAMALAKPFVKKTALAAICVLLLMLVNWNIHIMSKPAFSYGPDAGNILGTGRLNLADLVTNHPFDLPVFQFEQADGYWVVTAWRDTLWGYPDYLSEYFGPFDAVGRATGVAYETASMILFLAILGLSLLPAGPQSEARRGPDNHSHGTPRLARAIRERADQAVEQFN